MSLLLVLVFFLNLKDEKSLLLIKNNSLTEIKENLYNSHG